MGKGRKRERERKLLGWGGKMGKGEEEKDGEVALGMWWRDGERSGDGGGLFRMGGGEEG
jgi:hypothetical protein